MFLKTKYIKTKGNQIIVFSGLLTHSEFSHFEPKSAGFISIGTKKVEHNGNIHEEPDCTCYGDSVSLGIKADEGDSALARKQILGYIFE